jgi:hypothetical protein
MAHDGATGRRAGSVETARQTAVHSNAAMEEDEKRARQAAAPGGKKSGFTEGIL